MFNQENFDKLSENFSETHKTIQRVALYWAIGSVAVTISILSFIAWVIIKFMAHYGVL